MNARRMQRPEQAKCGCWNCLCVRGTSLRRQKRSARAPERTPDVFPKEAHLLQVQVTWRRSPESTRARVNVECETAALRETSSYRNVYSHFLGSEKTAVSY
jgi:hypothetical protein